MMNSMIPKTSPSDIYTYAFNDSLSSYQSSHINTSFSCINKRRRSVPSLRGAPARRSNPRHHTSMLLQQPVGATRHSRASASILPNGPLRTTPKSFAFRGAPVRGCHRHASGGFMPLPPASPHPFPSLRAKQSRIPAGIRRCIPLNPIPPRPHKK